MGLLEDLARFESDKLEEFIANTVGEVTMQAAVDSGSCANVAHPDDMPKGAIIEHNIDDKHFSGAAGGLITKHGTCRRNALGVLAGSPQTGVALGQHGRFIQYWRLQVLKIIRLATRSDLQ